MRLVGRPFWALGSAAGAALGAVILLGGLVLSHPVPAQAALDAPDGPAIVLAGDPPGAVHVLTPGVAALWNVGVTVRRMPVSSLLALVAAQGGFASDSVAVPATIELLGCFEPWAGDTCPRGERLILPRTSAPQLTDEWMPLTDERRPIPARVWVQVRLVLAADAPSTTSGELDVRLTVDATGGDDTPASVADTGSSAVGPAMLALSAVVAGLVVSGIARRRRV